MTQIHAQRSRGEPATGRAQARKVVVVLGTRPEAIKLAPVVQALRTRGHVRSLTWCTGQHRELLQGIETWLELPIDLNLNRHKPGQSLPQLFTDLLAGLSAEMSREQPHAVVVQGDTATAAAAALSAYLLRIPVFHVEAGLRTYDLDAPWPEEGNRRIISAVGAYHFAPTDLSKANLVREGIEEDRVFVTGNPIVDAFESINRKLADAPSILPSSLADFLDGARDRPLVLLTSHRRENAGRGFREIAEAVRFLASRTELAFVVPVHPNPAVASVFNEMLRGIPYVHLCGPLEYGPFIQLLASAWLVLSDSGGLQEEAACLQKPILILRDKTERPEVLDAGTGILVGADADRITRTVLSLLSDARSYQRMTEGKNPFGDGHAGRRIATLVEEHLYEQ